MKRAGLLVGIVGLVASVGCADGSPSVEDADVGHQAIATEALSDLLATPQPIPFVCDYTIHLPVTDPWGQPAGLRPFRKTGAGTIEARIVGDVLELSNQALDPTADIHGSAMWAPSYASFKLTGATDSLEYPAPGHSAWPSKYELTLLDRAVSLTYSYASRSPGITSRCSGHPYL